MMADAYTYHDLYLPVPHLISYLPTSILPQAPLPSSDYHAAEAIFIHLLNTPDLDLKVEGALAEEELVRKAQLLDMAVAAALDTAYGPRYAKVARNMLPTNSTHSALGLIVAAVASEERNRQGAAAPATSSNDDNDALNSMNGSSSEEEEAVASAAALKFSKAAAQVAATVAAGAGVYNELNEVDAAHLFLQRILYRINRLNLFW